VIAPATARVIELVGPAGAGKTTLARALPEYARDIKSGLTLWGLPRPLLLAGAVAAMPTIAGATRTRPLRGAAISQMIRLGALRHALDRSLHNGVRLVVLDEGPVFALSWLDVFHPRYDDPVWNQWRARMLQHWAQRLDVVVRVDDDDDVLAHRIRTRAKAHPVKHSPDQEIFRFLRRFRKAFDRVIAELATAGSVQVIDLAQSRTGAPGDRAMRLLDSLSEAPRER
jgi:thymidylate kinase